MTNTSADKIKVGISLGDINGIGIEVIIKTMLDNRIFNQCTPIVYGSVKTTSFHRKALNFNEFNFNIIQNADQANDKRANLINCWDEEVKIELGQQTPEGGKYAFKSLEAATADLKAGKIQALVTAPINKNNIQSEDFTFAGHTEYLQEQLEQKDVLMFLLGEGLRVGVVTGHIPVKDIAKSITKEKIISKLLIMNESLKNDFWIEKPKIAVLGLNPHAGDGGLIGEEETKIIIPAIEEVTKKGLVCFGPYGADGFFGSGTFRKFDAVLAMYHDQGLIPFKTLEFEYGVNFTAGLPVVRTSPDHGTAYEMAGKGIANENSFRQAIYAACDIYRKRTEQSALSSNPLIVSRLQRDRD